MKDTYKVYYWPNESVQNGYILPEWAKQEREFENLDDAGEFVESIHKTHFVQIHTIAHRKRRY